MKKTSFLFVLLGMLFFSSFVMTSCSSDDEPEDFSLSKDPALVGTWMVSNNMWGYQFLADGSCLCYERDLTYHATWGTRDGKVYIYWEDEPEPEVYAYSLSAAGLSLTDENETYALYAPGSMIVDGKELLGTWLTSDGSWGYGFSADGSCVIYLSSNGYPGSWSINQGKLQIVRDDTGDMEMYDFTLSGKSLSLTEEDETFELFAVDSETPSAEELVGMWAASHGGILIFFEADGTCRLDRQNVVSNATWEAHHGRIYLYENGSSYPSYWNFSIDGKRLAMSCTDTGETFLLWRDANIDSTPTEGVATIEELAGLWIAGGSYFGNMRLTLQSRGSFSLEEATWSGTGIFDVEEDKIFFTRNGGGSTDMYEYLFSDNRLYISDGHMGAVFFKQ